MKILILFLVGVIFKSSLCNNEPLGKHFYEDLKCTLNNDGKSYNCNVGDEKTCVFEGKTYITGEKIDDKSCPARLCRCTNKGTFSCPRVDCPSSSSYRDPSQCRRVHTHTNCCPVKDCTPATTNCTVDGKVYREGSRFEASECKTCICQKGFNGKFEEPFCEKQRCLKQLFYSTSLKNKCAPLYSSVGQCCPSGWVCNENQTIVKISEQTNSELSCDFGKDKVPYGYGFETSANVRCECTLPPLMTCLKN